MLSVASAIAVSTSDHAISGISGISQSRFSIQPCHQSHQSHQCCWRLSYPEIEKSSRIIQNEYVIYVYQVHFFTHCGLLRSLCLMLSAIGCMGIQNAVCEATAVGLDHGFVP